VVFNKEIKLKKSKLYDCFMFFNEIEILNLRFEYLSPYVDFFVLVESRKTIQGELKPLFFDENKLKFKKYAHKIKYFVVDDFKENNNAWHNESLQRNHISKAFSECDDNDLILISDVDEIPNLSRLPKKIHHGVVYNFLQDHLRYFVNTYLENSIIWEGGSKMVTFKTINDNLIDPGYFKFGPTFQSSYNQGITPTKVRMCRKTRLIYNGGYHLSYFGGMNRILKKLKSFPHTELIKSGKYSEKFITHQLAKGIDIINNTKIYRLPDREIFKLSRKLLPNSFFNDSYDIQNKFIYKFDRSFEIIKIFLRNFLRGSYLTFLSFIRKNF
jgi:beta-1,4-mannosyl-glycoprotein beta-1,4-N-acetylglucosaminyltransferase